MAAVLREESVALAGLPARPAAPSLDDARLPPPWLEANPYCPRTAPVPQSPCTCRTRMATSLQRPACRSTWRTTGEGEHTREGCKRAASGLQSKEPAASAACRRSAACSRLPLSFLLLSRSYNMVHTHEDYASFILAGGLAGLDAPPGRCAVLRQQSPGSRRCAGAGAALGSPTSTFPATLSLPRPTCPAAADHAEKGSRGPQSDSPTSDAYAPGYTNDTSFYTLRCRLGRVF